MVHDPSANSDLRYPEQARHDKHRPKDKQQADPSRTSVWRELLVSRFQSIPAPPLCLAGGGSRLRNQEHEQTIVLCRASSRAFGKTTANSDGAPMTKQRAYYLCLSPDSGSTGNTTGGQAAGSRRVWD